MEDLLSRITKALAHRYRVDRQLGGGGMATVFLAEDLQYHHPVAIKVLHPELAEVVGAARFLREIELTRSLNHNFIQTLHDSGRADGLPYYVMPVAGESLRDVLERDSQLPVEEAIRLIGEVAEALDHAHRNNVIHRDLKPENILIQEDHVRVADFGIARAIVEAGGEKLTATHMLVGTPTYMSPEQAAGERTLDGRSDVYSLACVLFEMLTGRAPYTGPAESLVFQHQSAPVPDVRSIRPSVPEAVARTIARGLSKTPAERFESAAEFARALAAPAPAVSRRTSTRGAIWAGVAVVAVVAAVLTILWMRGREKPSPDPERIAVLPFTNHGGDDLAHVGDAIALLLPNSFNGIRGIQSVDPRAISEYLGPRAEQPISAGTASDLAARFGAARLIRGDVIPVGSEVRIEAALYAAAGSAAPEATANVRGSPDSIGALVDRLAARIAVALRPNVSQAVYRVADRTSPSEEALLHFVRGSTSPSREAVSHFQRALDIDSTFALAAYRLGVAAQSVGSGLEDGLAYGRLRIAQALRHSGNLPLRDQQRIRAGYAVVHGDLSEAMATLDSIIAHHPDDVATLGHIAVLQSAMNPAYGRSFTEARKSVEQMSRLGASMLPLLRDIEYYEGNLERAESLSRRELSLAPWNRQARISHAVMFGDGLSVDSAAAMAGGLGPEVVSAMLRNWSVRGVPPDRLERFVSSLNESATSRIYDRWLARFALQRGRWREARARLAPMRGAEDVLFFARVSALPHVPVTSTWLDSLTRAVQALPVDPDVVIDTDAGTPSPGVRAYLLGLLAVRRGDFEEAARRSAELDGLRSVGPPEARELVVDLAAGVRARMRWAQGDPAGALASLEAAPMRPWWGPTHGIRFRVHERFLRAELLHELGRYAEALPWFETLPQGTADGLLHDATAHLRMAQIHERLGHADRAISHYGAFIDLWADCDPELRPQVDAARARRQALMAGAG